MKKLLNVVAKIGVKSAVKSCGTASMFGCHQPKEPESLKQISKQK